MYYYYSSNNNNRNSNNNNNWGGGVSWALIAVLFAFGLWPVALPLLIYKLFATPSSEKKYTPFAPSLSEAEAKRQAQAKAQAEERQRQKDEAKSKLKSMFASPKEGKAQSAVLITLGTLVALLSLLTLSAGTDLGIGIVLFFISTLIAGGALILSGGQMNAAMKRYGKYAAIIGANEAVEIESLATKTGFSVRRVKKDLEKMIEKGYFGKTAYVNHELGYLFMSSRADEELMKAKQAALQKTTEAARQEAAKQSANVYEQFLYQIRDVNDRIPGEEMTEKISKIEDITRKIFLEVEKEPKKRGKIDRFMTYYLPTTLKLLEHYAKLDSTKVEGENIVKSKESIENAMDSIVDGFTRQLDELYKTDNLDIETDIDVLVQMMDREKNKAKEDFKSV